MCETEEYFFRKKTNKQLKTIIQMLELLIEEVHDMSVELDALVAQVGETEGVEASVITLLQGIQVQLTALAADLAAAQVDNAKVLELRDSLHASEEALAAAAATFTPPVP
jgi:hypothetical protein